MLLLQFFEEASNGYFVFDERTKLADGYTLLLHCVAIAKRYAVVSQRIVVDSDTVRRTDSILSAIALTDGILFFIFAIEVELQIVHDLTCLFGQTVFLDEWQYGQLHRSKGSGQFEHCARLAILELLFLVGVAHHREGTYGPHRYLFR